MELLGMKNVADLDIIVAVAAEHVSFTTDSRQCHRNGLARGRFKQPHTVSVIVVMIRVVWRLDRPG